MADCRFNDGDRQALDSRGISLDEAERQLDLLNGPTRYLRLVRPCTIGDGIEVLTAEKVDALQSVHAAASSEGRLSKFVPASGAATRMSRELIWYRSGAGCDESWDSIRHQATDGSSSEARLVVEFFENLNRFAFRDDLEWVLKSRGENLHAMITEARHREVLDALLGSYGLDYSRLPKGLLKFHAYPDGARTPFDEHLVEAAGYARSGNDRCRLHFTVAQDHLEAFRMRLAEVRDRFGGRLGVAFDVDWSTQEPATDTLAVDSDGNPVRDAAGALLFRPGGHGALIHNLGQLDGDIVFLKNIDNVQPDRVKPVTIAWKRALAGMLVQLQKRTAAAIERLRADETRPLEIVMSPVGPMLHISLNGRPNHHATRDELICRLDSPLRVCGVVRNTGEPGGGPFWVRGRDGIVTVQIVEGAQVDPADAEQQSIFRASTHFNPVDLVCGLRDASGQRYDLDRFVDPDAVIVTEKSVGGSHITALERPGLWNGAMAGWNTVFVEVPLETFSPVKSVMDLLRPAHQPV